MSVAPDLREQVSLARQHFCAGILEDAVFVQVSGKDASSFLNNRTTNDLSGLTWGTGQMTAVLTPRGTVQGIFPLYAFTENQFGLILPKAHAQEIIEKICQFKVTEEVNFQVENGWGFIVFQGPEAQAFLRDNRSSNEGFRQFKGLGFNRGDFFGVKYRCHRYSLTGDDGYLLRVDKESLASVWEQFEARLAQVPYAPLTPALLEVLRIEAGIPKHDIDYNEDTLLPQLGVEHATVSYAKGCFPGQEPLAKMRAFGSPPTALAGIVLEPGSPLPALKSPCIAGGKKIGTFASSVASPTLGRPIAMVYLDRDHRVPGRTLQLEIDGQPVTGQIKQLPFYLGSSEDAQAKAFLDKGLSAFAQNQEAEAITFLEKAIDLDPTLADAYESLGVILSRQEKYPEAIALMETLLKLDPNRIMAHTNLSIYFMKLGDKERAEEEKAKATTLSMKAAFRESEFKKQNEEEQKQKEQLALERIELFKKALKIEQGDPLANYGLGSSYMELARYDDAVPPLMNAIQSLPHYTAAYFSLGQAFEHLSKKEEAKATYRRGVDIAAKRNDKKLLEEMNARLLILDS